MKWLAALFVAAGLFVFFLFILLLGFTAAMQTKPLQITEKTILVIDLGMNLVDSPASSDPISEMIRQMQGIQQPDVPLRHAMKALDQVRDDPRIEGVLLVGNLAGSGMGNSLAALAEFRSKLQSLQSSGKKVWAYLDNDGLGDFYLKSVAEKVWMQPYSLLDFRGIGTEMLYWGETFDRMGIGIQVVKAGEFKDAAESFESSTMSESNRQQLTELIQSIWGDLLDDMAASRNVDTSLLNRMASERGLVMAYECLELGVVDALVNTDDLIERLIKVGAFDKSVESFRQVAFLDYLELQDTAPAPLRPGTRSEVAVVYVEGAIVDGEGDTTMAGGDAIARRLRKVRQDPNVKAVVLRVNSPGGSATASEKILREVDLIQQIKPVVVSMGGYATSGGYWVSSLAGTIVAEPMTITGSIGVISMLPNIQGLTERYDLNVERVESNEMVSLFSLFREKTPEELARFEHFTQNTYSMFLDRVGRGRKLTPEQVLPIAEGRVWSGRKALELGLVDKIGGLEEAIAEAASLAGLGSDYRISDHPRKKSFEEMIAELLTGGSSGPVADAVGKWWIRDRRLEPLHSELKWLQAMNDPHHIYAYSPLRLRW